MKAIRWIQNVAAVVAIAMAVSLADGIGITFKEACTAGMLVVLAVVMLLGRALEEERRTERCSVPSVYCIGCINFAG